MHGDIALFATFTMALVTAFAGGLIARRLGLPSLVGYLGAGLVIGPFTVGFVGNSHYMSQLAEMGVIFMMFGVGVHFSLKDLWSVRTIAIPGALAQMACGTLGGFLLARWWGWSVSAGLVMGAAISVASTVVLLRGLTDHGLLSTMHGKVAVGWLVLEDLATVAILVVMPLLFGAHSGREHPWLAVGVTAVQLLTFIALMLVVGARLIPWLLGCIAVTRSRELFILAVVAIALGVAFGAAAFFGVSLALGAFLAGVVLGESDVGHQVGAEIIPFRDIFAVLFFVSVGMLVNPMAILASWGQVLMLSLLVVFGKWLINLSLGLLLPASATTMLVVAAGLSQIGEFTFIVGAFGVSLGVLSQDQYGLILAAATISIMVNPFMFALIPHQEALLQRAPRLWVWLNTSTSMPAAVAPRMHEHIIIVGHGRVGTYVGRILTHLHLPYLAVESDAVVAKAMQEAGIVTVFGDAANSEILHHTGMAAARALVVTVADETTALVVVASAHAMAPHLPIIARAATEAGLHRLAAVGASHIIHPELEGGLEIMRHTLLALGYPPGHMQPYVDAVRRDAYAALAADGTRPAVLDQLLSATRGVAIAWHPVVAHSALVGKSLKEANLRARIGASVIALLRDGHVMPNPPSDTHFAVGDLVGVIGTGQELAATAALLAPPRPCRDDDP